MASVGVEVPLQRAHGLAVEVARTDIQLLQRRVGSAPDGVIGPKTVRALQATIGARKNGARYLDRETVRSLQRYLNAH